VLVVRYVQFIREMPTSVQGAEETTATGGGSPAEVIPVVAFDAGSREYYDYLCRMPVDYRGDGLTFRLHWTTNTTAGDCYWSLAIRHMPLNANPTIIDSHTYIDKLVVSTAPAIAFSLQSAIFVFIPNDVLPLAGETFLLRLSRLAADMLDTLDADAVVYSLRGHETL
jgi:hypothetical protein